MEKVKKVLGKNLVAADGTITGNDPRFWVKACRWGILVTEALALSGFIFVYFNALMFA